MIFSFIPEPKTASQAAYMARIIRRGETLFADGYKFTRGATAFPNNESLWKYYSVTSPEGNTYVVNLEDNTCQCEGCVKSKFCKHLIACHLHEEELLEESQVADLEEYARRHGLTD